MPVVSCSVRRNLRGERYDNLMNAPLRRIAAVDDHELSLRGLASVVGSAPDLTFVGMYPTVPDLLVAQDGCQLDLVVLDLRLGDDSDPAVNVGMLAEVTDNILILSALESPYLVRRALRAGVSGIMPKSEHPEVLLEAIRAAASGQPFLTTEWASAVDSDDETCEVGDREVPWQEVHLSPRQQEVLELYASGEPAKRVATITGLAQDTVNDYLERIKKKYQEVGRRANTKIELAFRAQEDGFLPGPTDPVIP